MKDHGDELLAALTRQPESEWGGPPRNRRERRREAALQRRKERVDARIRQLEVLR